MERENFGKANVAQIKICFLASQLDAVPPKFAQDLSL